MKLATLILVLLAASSPSHDTRLGTSGTPHVGTNDGRVAPAVGVRPFPSSPAVANVATNEGSLKPDVSMLALPLRGWATHYPERRGHAAAGPALRKALGSDWRGQRVSVCRSECVTVVLSDWCACGPRHGTPTVVDLAQVDFARLAPLGRGVIPVRVFPAIELPETDTAQ